jgi:hypothetical protein
VEPVLVVRLEQIVDGVEIERAHGVLVERGHEHDQRRALGFELRDDLETTEAGHLHVDEHHIRRERLDRERGGEAIARLARDLDVGLFAKPAAQFVARRGFVVHDEHAHHGACLSYGSVIRAVTDCASALRSSVARSP